MSSIIILSSHIANQNILMDDILAPTNELIFLVNHDRNGKSGKTVENIEKRGES